MYVQSTLALRTGAKSPAETTNKSMEITPAITDSQYFGIADTLCGPKLKLLLSCSHYNAHLYLGTYRMTNLYSSFVIFVGRNDDKQKKYHVRGVCSDLQSTSAVLYLHYFHGILVGSVNLMFFSSHCFFFGLTFYNLKTGQVHRIPLLRTLAITDTKWNQGPESLRYNESWLSCGLL